MPEYQIHKHWIGSAIIALVGVAAMAFLNYLLWFIHEPASPEAYLAALALVTVGTATVMAIFAYARNAIILNDSGIAFDKYLTPWDSTYVEADWNTVQSTSVSQDLLGRLFGYGTLYVQTSDADPRMVMSLLPDPVNWREYIDDHAEAV